MLSSEQKVFNEWINGWVASDAEIKLWNKKAAEQAENVEEMDYCCY